MRKLYWTPLALLALTACSKAPEGTAESSGPNNAVTRYAETLAGAPDKAQQSVDKLNAATSREHQSMNPPSEQPQ